jgi:hypothetical protein
VQVKVLVLDGPPEPFHENVVLAERPLPSMLMAIWLSLRTLTKSLLETELPGRC